MKLIAIKAAGVSKELCISAENILGATFEPGKQQNNVETTIMRFLCFGAQFEREIVGNHKDISAQYIDFMTNNVNFAYFEAVK